MLFAASPRRPNATAHRTRNRSDYCNFVCLRNRRFDACFIGNLLAELNDASDLERRETTLGVLKIARETIVADAKIEKRAREIEKSGIKPIDALHLASAEAGQAEYFCTCDDKLLKRAQTQSDLKTKTISPIGLFEEIIK